MTSGLLLLLLVHMPNIWCPTHTISEATFFPALTPPAAFPVHHGGELGGEIDRVGLLTNGCHRPPQIPSPGPLSALCIPWGRGRDPSPMPSSLALTSPRWWLPGAP